MNNRRVSCLSGTIGAAVLIIQVSSCGYNDVQTRRGASLPADISESRLSSSSAEVKNNRKTEARNPKGEVTMDEGDKFFSKRPEIEHVEIRGLNPVGIWARHQEWIENSTPLQAFVSLDDRETIGDLLEYWLDKTGINYQGPLYFLRIERDGEVVKGKTATAEECKETKWKLRSGDVIVMQREMF